MGRTLRLGLKNAGFHSMSDLKFTEAFAKYGAKLPNAMWAFSAIAEDGALVISCWQHKFSIPAKGVMRYTDQLSRWKSAKSPGKSLFVTHLAEAFEKKLPVPLVIASTAKPEVADAGEDASRLPKTFHVREDYVGEIVSFDGDAYVIDFKKVAEIKGTI